MIGDDHGDAAKLMGSGTKGSERSALLEQSLRRGASERDDDTRPEDFDLGADEGQAGGHFLVRRRSVARSLKATIALRTVLMVSYCWPIIACWVRDATIMCIAVGGRIWLFFTIRMAS